MVLEAAWEKRYGYRPEVFPGNNSILLQLVSDGRGEEILSLVTSGNLSGLIRQKLEDSGFFGARFRECAGRALLLPRRGVNERMPLWLSRLRSKRLLESVPQFEDFPILWEAWRSCLHGELDIAGLTRLLSELESGAITWSQAYTNRASPMARSMSRPQINRESIARLEPWESEDRDELFTAILLQWLQFYGPKEPEFIRTVRAKTMKRCCGFQEPRQGLKFAPSLSKVSSPFLPVGRALPVSNNNRVRTLFLEESNNWSRMAPRQNFGKPRFSRPALSPTTPPGSI
ncbi:MAG: hypothetical protein P4L43_08830 [Syntrophobacteraceae bacterium]|nr:hypothetical protein [Syntrophobacteraceae bacterium]